MTVPASETVILVTRNGMGSADPELQKKLISTYFQLLDENSILPAAICFCKIRSKSHSSSGANRTVIPE